MVETQKQPIRLRHFSIDSGKPDNGPSFIRKRLIAMLQEPPPALPGAQARTAQTASQLRAGDRFISWIIDTNFPKRKNSTDLLNETRLLSTNLERALEIVEANGTYDPRLKLEETRQMLLAGIVGELDNRSLTFRMRSELQDVHDLLDKKLFVGKIGETYPVTTYSLHTSWARNFGTNDVVSVSEKPFLFFNPLRHVKKFETQMRYVDGVGYVLSSVREKTREASIAKTLRRAIEKRDKSGDDIINP